MSDSDDLKPKEALGWLGEATDEDVQRSSGKVEDVYAAVEEDPAEQIKILEAFVLPSQRDPQITKFLILGGYLFLATTCLQMLRSESLRWPGPEKPSAAVTKPNSLWVETSDSLVVGSKLLPSLTHAKAEKAANGMAVIMVGLKNHRGQASLPAVVTIVLSSDGQAFKVQGPLPSLPAGTDLELPVETPLPVQGEIAEGATSFQIQGGQTVEFKVSLDERH